MEPAPFSYFHRLALEDQAAIRDVSRWQWIATVGSGHPRPDAPPAYQRWLSVESNLHTPSHREIMLILESHGPASFGLQGKGYRRQAGRIFLFDHHESRDMKRSALNRGHQTSLWLHLPVRDSESLTYNTVTVTKDQRTYRDISHRIYSGDAVKLIPKVWDECRKRPDEPVYWELLKAQIAALIMELLYTMEPTPSPGHQTQVVNYICRYLKEHFADDLALGSISDIAGYSPYFFHRIFRRQTGMTPKEYITHLRIARAKELLTEGQKVSAVSEAIGMQSPFTFSRFFKSHTGYSPATWRKLF